MDSEFLMVKLSGLFFSSWVTGKWDVPTRVIFAVLTDFTVSYHNSVLMFTVPITLYEKENVYIYKYIY